MVFSSTVFLFLFFPLILVFYYLPLFKNKLQARNIILLLFSLGFYAWGEPLFIFIMLISIIINWFCVIHIDSLNIDKLSSRKKWMIIAITFDIAMLFVFKYLTFSMNNLNIILPSLKLPQPEIALPIGISFFTFQIMSYVWDVYYGKAKVQKSLLSLALYISMFPQLIAGPIVRYETIADEINHRVETKKDFNEGMKRFVIGLAKKVIIANYVAAIADNIFAIEFTNLSTAAAWLGAISYSMQIYFDFSGYSDMAIGLGLMFGFHFDENFNYPYMANSVSNFWRRWHISLSTWFKDYVYIPMGGNRCKKLRWILNIFTVWLLTGVWHGANWTFIAWGLYYFVFLILERFMGITKRLGKLSRIYTLLVIIIGWVLFRSTSITNALNYISIMFGRGQGIDELFKYYLTGGYWFLIFGLIFSFPTVPFITTKLYLYLGDRANSVIDCITGISIFLLFSISIILSVSSTYNPFIYFNF